MARPTLPKLALWERATGVQDAYTEGLVKGRYSGRLTLAICLLFGVLLVPVHGFWGGVLALIFARLAALDLTSYTLPNVYTIPMMVVGLIAALGDGHLFATLALWLGLILVAGLARVYPKARLGVGEGDLKLLAAMAGFLPLPTVLLAIAIGCLLWMPVAFMAPKRPVPLGVPILIGWVMVILPFSLPL